MTCSDVETNRPIQVLTNGEDRKNTLGAQRRYGAKREVASHSTALLAGEKKLDGVSPDVIDQAKSCKRSRR